jgi:hypothetical protein
MVWLISTALPTTSMAQVVEGTGTYCLSGNSTGTTYSWAIDIGCDSMTGAEPTEFNEDPVLPVGAPASSLASAFQVAISNEPGALILNVNVTHTAGSSCFTVHPLKLCQIQDPNTPDFYCTAGTDVGKPCSSDADCDSTYCLLVGPAGSAPSCLVAPFPSGCAYNPVITLGLPGGIPVLDPWGIAILLLLVLTGGYWVLRRRSRHETA